VSDLAKHSGGGGGSTTTNTMISLVVTVVVAAVLYASLLGPYIANMQNSTNSLYVGATAAPLVGIITVFYWLGIALLSVAMIKFHR
jgi:hypothetical protein